MTKSIAVLATLDTKGDEAQFIREQLENLGSRAVLFDIGVINQPTTSADVTREEIATAGGKSLADILQDPTREDATPIMAAGTAKLLRGMLEAGKIDGAIGFGGLQGTSLCSRVLQQLPYGFPKIIVSTVASGDTSAYVDIKDITMMFSVGDILGLNPFTRKILAKAAGAAHGMAQVEVSLKQESTDKPLIGMSNLGVLTQGALEAVRYIHERGYEVIVFHAIGSGGRAMEQMMKEGIIKAVFDYAMGEIADEVYSCLRAGGPERLTVAGKLGIPQVLCPGGAEHLGILVEPNAVPEEWKDHEYVFHSPVVFVPRLRPPEFLKVADDILNRLQHTKGNAVMMLPRGGTGSYAKEGGPLRDAECDDIFFEHLKKNLPDGIEAVDRDTHAEDPAFVRECVDRLIDLIEK
ncbi:MAG: Tm-1-like ATP-binding domain-containing protein [Planctomycetota bacterium]|nr:Tm-1-like ATP-binding domain-containing protein [Planctomycetota bacterium]